jgi:OmpA-OmpF porin, OOP family
VRIYLIENYGIVQSRITTDGKGASLPVAPNTNLEGKAKNRRVEFTKVL